MSRWWWVWDRWTRWRVASDEPPNTDLRLPAAEVAEIDSADDTLGEQFGAAQLFLRGSEGVRRGRYQHLAIEALRRLIEQEMRKVTKHNIVRQQSFSDRLIELMNKYTNQNLTAAQVIAEMVAMAREVSADGRRGEQFSPNLTPDELAFYDAVAQNESAVDAMGVGVLADIARDLVRSLRRDVTTDWVSRDDVRAKLRTTIKRLLAVHGYPPDAEAGATQLVLTQMETFAEVWSPGKEG